MVHYYITYYYHYYNHHQFSFLDLFYIIIHYLNSLTTHYYCIIYPILSTTMLKTQKAYVLVREDFRVQGNCYTFHSILHNK